MAKKGAFGLKEVADVSLYALTDDSGDPTDIAEAESFQVGINATSNDLEIKYMPKGGTTATALPTADFIFDSLKVSNIENTSEDVSARGGKGNPELISWSYGKEITFTLEDALLTFETLQFMFGGSLDEDEKELTIDANTFPDNYLVIGTTVMRSYKTGKDEPFVFIIPKCKFNVNGTLTMQAEGDPSTFEMTAKALAKEVGADKDVLIKFYRTSDPDED